MPNPEECEGLQGTKQVGHGHLVDHNALYARGGSQFRLFLLHNTQTTQTLEQDQKINKSS